MTPLPIDFVASMQRRLGATEAEALCQALDAPAEGAWLRFNPLKTQGYTAGEGVEATPVPWCATGLRLSRRPAFTYDPLLHAGCFYVQEAASMFVEQAYRILSERLSPLRLLDLCAAPGGKSTLWRSLLPEGSLLVANEPVRQRAQILQENLAKWGHPDVVCTQAYPEEFASLGSFFDVVAADVPCSGEGMFRKDERARSEWSTEAVARCAARQRQIIADVWPALRQGGFLVYSTCTFNREENEDNVAHICQTLGAETVPLDAPTDWHIEGDTTGRGLHVSHFYPHRTEGEGFFMALLRKTSEAPSPRTPRKAASKQRAKEQPVKGARQAAGWLHDPDSYRLFQPTEIHLAAVSKAHHEAVVRLCATVRALSAGVLLAEAKGQKLIPSQALALSTALRPDAFGRVELSREEALAYLHREALVCPPTAPRGYVMACYDGHPLGFMNNLGTRANNLYPAEWRIRHEQRD